MNDLKSEIKKWNVTLNGTAIGEMLDIGMTDVQIGNALDVTAGAVNKWRNANNKASEFYQARAKGYLAGLHRGEDAKLVKVPAAPLPAPPTSFTIVPPAPEDYIFLVSVPGPAKNRFLKMMTLLNLNAVDLDE